MLQGVFFSLIKLFWKCQSIWCSLLCAKGNRLALEKHYYQLEG